MVREICAFVQKLGDSYSSQNNLEYVVWIACSGPSCVSLRRVPCEAFSFSLLPSRAKVGQFCHVPRWTASWSRSRKIKEVGVKNVTILVNTPTFGTLIFKSPGYLLIFYTLKSQVNVAWGCSCNVISNKETQWYRIAHTVKYRWNILKCLELLRELLMSENGSIVEAYTPNSKFDIRPGLSQKTHF